MTNVKEGVEKREPSYTVGGNANWCSYYGKLYRSSPPKKLKIEFPYNPVAPLLGMYPDKMLIQKDKWYSIFRAELFTIVKTWKQPKCPLTDKWPEKYTHWNTTQP